MIEPLPKARSICDERGVQRLRLVHPVPAVIDDSKRRYHGIPH